MSDLLELLYLFQVKRDWENWSFIWECLDNQTGKKRTDLGRMSTVEMQNRTSICFYIHLLVTLYIKVLLGSCKALIHFRFLVVLLCNNNNITDILL